MEGGDNNSEASAAGKKRKSRWGDAPVDVIATNPASSTSTENLTSLVNAVGAEASDSRPDEANADGTKKRQSRWSKQAADIPLPLTGIAGLVLPTPQVLSPEILQQTLILKMQLQQIAEKLLTVVPDAARIEADPNRSPSPPPKYDSNGKRSNTREVRMREDYNRQRNSLIEELVRINPQYQPPPDYVKQKPVKRIYIPYREFPTYNFIGLIIGPRGNTQKQLEQETGCKISIRGKGSVKEGSKGRAGKQAGPDEDDELHVHIMGDDMQKVEQAFQMVEDLLRPVDDEKNEHKQKQLRELALINGTLREDEFCPVCGEKGHRQFECPHRSKTFKAAGVKCAICGDLSHPTRDCPLKNEEPTNAVALDSEYNSFMAELTGGDPGPARPQPTTGTSSASASTGTASSGRLPSFSGDAATSNNVAMPLAAPAPKKQQTIIHVTTVLTGTIPVPPLSSATASTTGTLPYPAPPAPSVPGVTYSSVPGYPTTSWGAAPAVPVPLPGSYDHPYGQYSHPYGQATYGQPWIGGGYTHTQPVYTVPAPVPAVAPTATASAYAPAAAVIAPVAYPPVAPALPPPIVEIPQAPVDTSVWSSELD